ncbi:hypothetical protein [Frateuria terrea]|uniref:Lipoprotein n=1 Tax=Frateuria terrea TaxID=529704 RepID=A0A1H6WTH3_9GAMM|nr:hypothetical protein [Frateuria terrea]SEJ18544.1 hypothetical protein SAMN04487997_2666 [Frateuria terrea]SFP57023.1 hypothetical protein SAMN02927913_2643 [Frateuria terrea]
MRRQLLLLLAFVAMLCAGCATDQRNQALIHTLGAYGSTLRWGDFQSALQFVDPKVREANRPTALDLARYQQVRVTGYDDGAGPVPDGENVVHQVVQISLVNINTQSERTVIDRQTWRYDTDKKRWWLMSGLPDITRE